MYANWLVLSCLFTSKGVVFAFGLTQSVATSCHKGEGHSTFSWINKCLWNYYAVRIVIFWRKVNGMWTFNDKYRSIVNKVRTFELMVSSIVSQWSYSLGNPGAHKRNLWPPHLKSSHVLHMEVTAYAADLPHVWPRVAPRKWETRHTWPK